MKCLIPEFIDIHQSGLKMSSKNCETATDTIKFLGNDLSAGISREKTNVTKFLDNFEKQKAKKQVKN